MSEASRAAVPGEGHEGPKPLLRRLLDGVERLGNKVPHPAVIFFILAGFVIVLSHVLWLLGISVTRTDPAD